MLNGILGNWESLCDMRPDCHHHFDASGTPNVMFDEFLGRNETYVLKTSSCDILTILVQNGYR